MVIDQKDRPTGESKRSSLATAAYQHLYADITSGRLAPGQKLLAAELSARYEVGLSPLRDALNRLCADGLAVNREQKGFFVADLNEAEFLQITNVRLVLEETALRLSIQNGGAQWEEDIVVSFHRLAKVAAGSGSQFVLSPEWSTHHQNFHFALLAACQNDWLLGFCKKLYEQTTRYRARRRLISAGGPLRVQRNLVKVHRDIMERCLARESDQAVDLLIDHYKVSFELVMGAKYRLLNNPRRLVPEGDPAASKQRTANLDMAET